ncbi:MULTISPECIES: hypothetical protein [Pedobacter]|uniref:hypothetical protein n=1 Tax=Pedobacter TaxID=84567 RepID=UPI00210C41CB|nr:MULTISPECIES: hypothetical protein [unclassified Pedobacter]
MGKLNVEGRNGLTVYAYRKRNNAASLVFRRGGGHLFRLTKIVWGEQAITELERLLTNPPADGGIMMVESPRGRRHWVIEVIADDEGRAVLAIWEIGVQGKTLKRFSNDF